MLKKLITIAAIFILLILACSFKPPSNELRAKTTIEGWKFEFWKLRDNNENLMTVNPGDTLTISWSQELTTIPRDAQQAWGIGDTTGEVITFYLSIEEVINVIYPDSTKMDCKVVKSITLSNGIWALVMSTKGNGGLWSKHSKPFWFRVKSNPPNMPVEIKVWVKP